MPGRTAQNEGATTATRILDVAEGLLQTRGYNGFSYADIASELDVTKAALHYHFPTKADLGEALVTRYAERFMKALAAIEAGDDDPRAKLDAYADLYAQVLQGRRMCMCGMLAAEYQTLPEPMRARVLAFFDENVVWLERVLERGRVGGVLAFRGSAAEAAMLIVDAMEGTMLVSRSYADPARFRSVAGGLLDGLVGGRPDAAPTGS
jgi:TetR/AcrR family transcriptional repressor of nem operon